MRNKEFYMLRIILGLAMTWMLAMPAQAVDFKWMNADGNMQGLETDYKNQAVVVHVWASWCPPCVAEMPEMVAWMQKHPEVKVVAVSVDNSLEEAQNFLNKEHIAIPARLTDRHEAAKLLIRGLPTTILLNAKGERVDTRIGMQDWSDGAWSKEVLALF